MRWRQYKRRSVQVLVFLFILALIIISRVLKKDPRRIKQSMDLMEKWTTGSLAKPNTNDIVTKPSTNRSLAKPSTNGDIVTKPSTNRSLTVVTAFFDIGTFPKGGFNNMRDSNTYNKWAGVFSQLQNPLVVYTDNLNFETLMRQLRSNYSDSTVVIRVNRSDLWSFQIMPEIKKIYETPGYPKHYPGTYIPEYTSVMHAKHEVMANAIKENFFKTEYFTWLDIGHFRDITGRNRKFWLEVPDDFDSRKIGMTRVFNADLQNITAKTIMLQNKNWLCGSLFLGKADVMLKFGHQYKEAVMRYLKQGLSNTDQQILYAMYTKQEQENHPLEVDLQLYIPGQKAVIKKDPWFYLGYVMYRETPSDPVKTE